MPNSDVSSPVSAAPVDRLTLRTAWVRPSAGGIGGAINPAGYMWCSQLGWCFEGDE